MASLVQSGKYGNMNTTDTSTMGYYVITCFFEAYTLQHDTTCDGQISSAGELVVNSQYLRCMQEKTNWYWEQKQQQQFIIIPTRTTVHICLDVMAVKYVHNIPGSVCKINQKKRSLQRHLIFLTDSDHDSIFEEIEGRHKI